MSKTFSLKESYPFYLANKPESPNCDLVVYDKFTKEIATKVPKANPGDINRALNAASHARSIMNRMTPYDKRAVLEHGIQKFKERFDELAYTLCIEAGKPVKDSKSEVTRLIETFQIAADESTSSSGEVLNLEINERTRGYRGFTKRVPIGVCSFISPFNFPLNLVAHKIAPAIAVGCPFILKPASFTPVGALLIGEILAETDLPEGAFSILPCSREAADLFTTDERISFLSFTGSPDVGWNLKNRAGKKKVTLELGGNAACIVDRGVNIDDAVSRIIIGAFYQSGQSCISVQRILLHESIANEFEEKFVAKTLELKSGNPLDENTFIGPMISENEAARVHAWIRESLDAGATLLCGGSIKGSILEATILKGVPEDQKLFREEAFGPVAILSTFSDYESAIEEVNNSRFGIHAGVFTPSIKNAFMAWDTLEVGGVLINEMPSWRMDSIPYGGVKDSGIGREGIKYAMEDMSEIRSLIVRET